MNCYYAHCTAIYNTPQEARDLETLKALGFDVYNPNCPECAEGYKAKGMSFFEGLVKGFPVVAFRALPDGRIPAGVANEVRWAADAKAILIELPSGIVKRSIGVDETREYLREVGQR